METLLTVLDLGGIFVFALSGAVVGVRKRLDLFGVLVLAFAASTGGGMLRDVLIGANPPVVLDDWRYSAVCIASGVLTFVRFDWVSRVESPVQIFDAIGLSLYAVVGSLKALEFGLAPFAAVMIGMLTGIGGGVIRDILVARVPTVFTSEFYAMAALAGALIVVLGDAADLPVSVYGPAAALVCFLIRVNAIRSGWRLPIARELDQPRP